MEFLFVMGMAITIGIILVGATASFYSEKRDEQNLEIAKEILISIENELLVASKVRKGYERDFEVPSAINNVNYSIEIDGGDIILTYSNIDFIGVAPNITGQLLAGTNTIRNYEGKVCLNLVTC